MPSLSVLVIGASVAIAIPTEASKKDKFTKAHKQGFELVVGSFTSPSSFNGFDTVLCLLGCHAMKYQPAIIDPEIAGGVRDSIPPNTVLISNKVSTLQIAISGIKSLLVSICERLLLRILASTLRWSWLVGLRSLQHTRIFGVDAENHTFTFYGPPEKEEPFTLVSDVAKYIVESILLPKDASGERAFRVPGGLYAWKDIIATISKANGVEYKTQYLPNEDAAVEAAKRVEKGDIDGELAHPLKTIMGDPTVQGVPKPWDNDKFSFKPETFEVAMKKFFADKK